MKRAHMLMVPALAGVMVGLAGCGVQSNAASRSSAGDAAGLLNEPESDRSGSAPTSDLTAPINPDARGPLTRPEPEPFGTWLLEDGELLPLFDNGLEVTALILEDDGYARVFFRDVQTNANDCARAFALYDGETLALDLSAEPNSAANPERTMFFPVVVVEFNRLGLADETGQIALFSRKLQLPPEVTCGELEVLDVFEGLPNPHSFGDLVLHFGDLIYNSTFPADQIERFDLDTNMIIAPVAPTQNRFVQAKQGFDFWTHCGCGGSPEATRRTLISVIDTVHTGNDLGEQITIRAAEFVPTTNRLWLHGRSNAGNSFQFLVVNSNAEPDVLEQEIFFNRDVRGLSFDGTDLWGFVTMASRSICRIDPVTGKVTKSFELPDEDINWTGLEPVGDDLYLIGSDANQQGVIYRVVLP